jgi:pyruvate/2-oxoglutarate dehydrogenase complex dihydrolipoamide acyltransferase (E2) component
MTCDHRVLDGVIAARFLQSIKRVLENPIEAMPKDM